MKITMIGTFNGYLKKNNKGISLVEIIVVVAILSVLIGVTSLGFGMVSTRSATQAAKNSQISIERCRINSMGKISGCIAFFQTADGIFAVEDFDYSGSMTIDDIDKTKAKKIGKNDVNVTYGYGDTADTPLADGIVIEFNRSDGSVKNISSNTLTISFNKGSKTQTVRVDRLTGRVTLTNG